MPFWSFILANIWRTGGSGTIWVYSSVILQRGVPEHFLGRTFAFDFAFMTMSIYLFFLIFTFLHTI